MDDEIPLSGTGWLSRATVSGVVARDRDEQGDGDLCGLHQPGSCAYADRYSTAAIGIPSGAVSEGEEFAPVVVRVQGIKEAVLGSASMGEGLLGGFKRERDG
jgi:hypothetical protein